MFSSFGSCTKGKLSGNTQCKSKKSVCAVIKPSAPLLLQTSDDASGMEYDAALHHVDSGCNVLTKDANQSGQRDACSVRPISITINMQSPSPSLPPLSLQTQPRLDKTVTEECQDEAGLLESIRVLFEETNNEQKELNDKNGVSGGTPETTETPGTTIKTTKTTETK